MVRLAANTAGQDLWLTLNEARQEFSTTFTNYLLVLTNLTTREDFALIPTITSESDRITRLTLGLNVNNAVNGSIQITKGGRYLYKVYGQNSSSNLDPDDAVVVGECERGWIEITDGTTYYDEASESIPEGIVPQP